VGSEKQRQEGLRLPLGFATSRMPSQQSRPILPRVEHAGEGSAIRRAQSDGFAWRRDCLTCRTHWSCSVPKSYFLFFYVFIFYVFIFLEKQFAIGGMAYFDE
jgi:hypothetical protein